MLEIIAGAVMALAVIFHFSRIRELKKSIKDPQLIYIDRDGIDQNPPRHFIESWTNKTINFKLDKFTISIAQIPIHKNLRYLKKIAEYHNLLIKYVEYEPQNKIDEMRANLLYKQTYERIIELIYELSYQLVKKKKRFKKALYKKAESDVLWTLDVCEQVSDYWKLVKKKALLLAGQATLRQTVGEHCSWNSVNFDTGERISIKSRFGKFWNSVPRETTGYSEKMKSKGNKNNNGNS